MMIANQRAIFLFPLGKSLIIFLSDFLSLRLLAHIVVAHFKRLSQISHKILSNRYLFFTVSPPRCCSASCCSICALECSGGRYSRAGAPGVGPVPVIEMVGFKSVQYVISEEVVSNWLSVSRVSVSACLISIGAQHQER